MLALQHETGLCKNMLQEYAQKMNYAIPSYVCTRQTGNSAPFVCTVEIGGIQYIGASATTKRDAEIKAARTALLAIQSKIVATYLILLFKGFYFFCTCLYAFPKLKLRGEIRNGFS